MFCLVLLFISSLASAFGYHIVASISSLAVATICELILEAILVDKLFPDDSKKDQK